MSAGLGRPVVASADLYGAATLLKFFLRMIVIAIVPLCHVIVTLHFLRLLRKTWPFLGNSNFYMAVKLFSEITHVIKII